MYIGGGLLTLVVIILLPICLLWDESSGASEERRPDPFRPAQRNGGLHHMSRASSPSSA